MTDACFNKKGGREREVGATAEDYDMPAVCAVAEKPDIQAITAELAEQRKLLEKLLRGNPDQQQQSAKDT